MRAALVAIGVAVAALSPARAEVKVGDVFPSLAGADLVSLSGGELPALAAAGSVFSGCANANLVRVKPWERATLTTYAMRPDHDPLHTTMDEHIFFSRETASGGRGVGGSGCGCN